MDRKTLPQSTQEKLARILEKGPSGLTDDEKAFLQARRPYLVEEEKKEFGIEDKEAPQEGEETKKDEKKDLISAKDAVDTAVKYFREITGSRDGISLEEVEFVKEGEEKWNITLGYRDERTSFNLYQQKILYKIITVDAHSGEVLSMKIRKV